MVYGNVLIVTQISLLEHSTAYDLVASKDLLTVSH